MTATVTPIKPHDEYPPIPDDARTAIEAIIRRAMARLASEDSDPVAA